MENNSTNGYGTSGIGSGASGAGIGSGESVATGSAYDTGAAYGGAAGAYESSAQRAGGMSGEMRNLIADVEDLLKGVANVGDADVAKLRARVTDTLNSAKVSLREGTESLRLRANDAATTADSYVRERPWAAIGVAAAVGVVVGLWAGRRGSNDY